MEISSGIFIHLLDLTGAVVKNATIGILAGIEHCDTLKNVQSCMGHHSI
jgi:hypothetical protein